MEKTKYTFKPFDSLEWNKATEKDVKKALTENAFKVLKQKNYITQQLELSN